MEGIFICLHLLLLQYALFSVNAQTVTLSTERKFVENSNATFLCKITTTWNTGSTRTWFGPGSLALISDGVSTNNRYVEDISNAATSSQFSMTIINYGSSDEGDYQCQYGFPTSNTITLSTSNTEVHPSTNSLDAAMPLAPEAINITIVIAGIRPAATASYNFTDSAGILKVNGNANVTSTNDPNGRTVTSSLQIDIPDPTSAGDIFTITLLVGTYTQTKQWIIQANPNPNPDCPCTGETVLLSLSIAIMCMVLMHAWLVFLFTKGIIKWNIPTVSECDNEKSPVNIIVVTITISLCCVIGMVLCAVGMSICQKCTSSDDNTGLILAIVGFVLVVVGLVVDILYVCIFQKKTGHGEVAQVNKGELDENKTNATDDEKDGLLKDGQTSKAEEPSGKEDEQNVKKDEQNTKEDEQNRKGDEEKGKTDKTEEQNGKDDEQVEKKIEQDGEKVDETGKKDDQSGKKDEQPGKNEHNIIRASPKEKETHKDGDPV